MDSFYRKEIDFLRSIAVVFVILYHYFPNILSKGYLGVDLFFVISGFLISYQIYTQTIEKKFSLKDFYVRRIKRILPASLFTLILVFFASLYLMTDNDFFSFLKSSIYSLFFSANFFFWTNGGYFGPNDELKPLLHLWSLGIEEQFYLIFPLIFIFLIKIFKKKKIIFFVILFITFLSFILNILLLKIGGSNPAFFLLPTRIWNLSFGILAMLLFIDKKKTHTNFEASFYIFLIFFGVLYEVPVLPTNFLIIFSTFLLLTKELPKNFVFKKLVQNKYFNYIGLISFSLYLWHWPILVLFKYYYVYEVSFIIKILSLVLMFILSIFSYHIIELKFRYKISFKILIIIISGLYIFFISFYFYNKSIKENIQYKSFSPNFISSASLTNFKCETNNFYLYKKKRACIINKKIKKNYSIALIGNSHAQMYAPSILPFLKEKSQKAILLPMTGCLPTITLNLNQDCLNLAKEYFEKYTSDDQINTVIIATTWWHENLYNGEKYLEDKKHLLLSESLLQLIEQIKKFNKKVYLVGPIVAPLYELPQDLSRLFKFKHLNENEIKNRLKTEVTTYEDNYKEVNRLLSNKLSLNYVNIIKDQCDENFCYYSDKNGIFFADGSHLSSHGAKLFSKNFRNIFE